MATHPETSFKSSWSGLCVLLVLALFGYLSGAELLSGFRQIRYFERATGTVTTYTAPDRNGDVDLMAGRIEFDYEVRGHAYQGRYPPDYAISMPRAPYPILDLRWHAGDRIEVWYDPGDPRQATLEPRMEASPLAVLTFVAPFVLFAGILLFSDSMPIDERSLTFFAFMTLSIVGALVLMSCAISLPWRVSLVLGIIVPTIVIPSVVSQADGSLSSVFRARRTFFKMSSAFATQTKPLGLAL